MERIKEGKERRERERKNRGRNAKKKSKVKRRKVKEEKLKKKEEKTICLFTMGMNSYDTMASTRGMPISVIT